MPTTPSSKPAPTTAATPHDGLVSDAGEVNPAKLREAARQLEARTPEGSLLVITANLLPPSTLVPHLRAPALGRDTGEREGFVVVDMPDVDDFAPATAAELPGAAVYAVTAPDRGDDMRNTSPAEAEVSLMSRDRSPLTLAEGVHWALQTPSVLARNACYMTIGSRLRKATGFDSRTPALWISNGTGRDGRERRGAPKAGWCWWNNRHTWLGFASGTARIS